MLLVSIWYYRVRAALRAEEGRTCRVASQLSEDQVSNAERKVSQTALGPLCHVETYSTVVYKFST